MKRVLLCAALIAWSGMALAVVYKWVDAQGKTQYGDRPPDGIHAEIVELLGTHAADRSASPVVSTSRPRMVAQEPALAEQASAKQAVQEDVAQTKEKQCADAQAHYKQLIEGRRLYKTGADGEREYLTSAEIDTERVNAKIAVDTTCDSST